MKRIKKIIVSALLAVFIGLQSVPVYADGSVGDPNIDNGGGGLQSLGRDFAALLPESNVLPPKAFSGSSIKSSVKVLEEFAADRIAIK